MREAPIGNYKQSLRHLLQKRESLLTVPFGGACFITYLFAFLIFLLFVCQFFLHLICETIRFNRSKIIFYVEEKNNNNLTVLMSNHDMTATNQLFYLLITQTNVNNAT